MEGRNLKQPDRSSPVENFDIRNPRSGVVDSLSNEWTDEKHNLYLSSMETTFVNQLYGKEHLSGNFMGWLSRTQKKTDSSQSNPNKNNSDQFKVLRHGRWEDFKFDLAKSKAVNGNESRHLSANSWVQHFKPSAGKHPQASVDVDNNGFSSRSIKLNSPTNEKRTCAKPLPLGYPLMFHQGSISSRAEVTDQNFVDTEYEVAEEPSRSSSKKRPRRSTHSKIIDQIVPCNSVAASSHRSDFLKENEAEFSRTIRQQKIDEPSDYNHKEPEGLGFNNG
ncbi:uncharacterized protein LOC110028958 [Phalaenopsis equestris]|uniref:uncharacterized protein LOC110028958 n=1 Tax=Phalaenopsis equestris TaxID=78828 RepID=UPI0009E46B32|nr:uncharacterized protein LOC110028958 [Phalaenopsis equestris]XP_020586700.1 uncharacterized protein LOC110028958 [Phalaenopsis equestris]